MKHTTITIQELECLEHLRNVGHFVNVLMQEQDCTTLRRDPAQQSQLPDDRPARRRGRALQPALADRGG